MASTNIQSFPGKVGVSNTNPIHTLDIGSNVYIDDTSDTKIRVYGNIHASGVIVDGSITVIETDNLSVKDPVLLLASGSTGTSDTGIIMKRADGDANVAIFYDEGVGLNVCHTLSRGDEIHLSVDGSNALATSIYGPVHVVNTGTEALVVDGGSKIDGNLQVGTVGDLFVDTVTSNVGVGTNSPAYKLDVNGQIFSRTALAPSAATQLYDLDDDDAKILFYKNSYENWAGMGCDDGGSLWMKAGTTGQGGSVSLNSAGRFAIGHQNSPTLLGVNNMRTTPTLYYGIDSTTGAGTGTTLTLPGDITFG